MLIRCRPRVARFGLLGSIVGGALVTVAVGSAAAADPPAGCTTTGDVTTCVFAYTGAAHVKQAAVELMRQDLARFTPIAFVLVLLVLWFSFRTVRG